VEEDCLLLGNIWSNNFSMSIFNNKKHFLHQYISYIESTGIDGKNGGFNQFLSELGISTIGTYWDFDHSVIDWNNTKNHHQFYFDYIDNNAEITNFLKNSDLSNSGFLFTWLDWNDPIIKIKTIDFIENWEAFYRASVEGMVLTTTDGKFYLEFTNDWKYHLNSNFEIKSNTSK
jgi:hypothetical protein